ncbi:MAG TPA: ATP-binding protein [Rectinema sp.]|jgi:DNA replication protein DnaC|nr:ATP-binding protein [Rectinema sp.]
MRKARVNRSQSRTEISLLLKRMAFSQTAVRLCEEEADAAEEAFLLKVLEREMASREEARRVRFLHEAAFPVYKSFEGFDFSSVKLPPALPKEEWGYVPLDRQGAQLLFRIIAESYERRSIVLTTNLEFSKWGTIFTDDQMAAAIIDKLAHHGHIVLFEGESYRMKHALMRQREEEELPTS